MNWKLILQLSLFGLAMAIGTVFLIPPTVEAACWLVILLISSYVIARRCATQRFQHGIYLGMANAVWITASRLLFFDRYLAAHPQDAAMINSIPVEGMGKSILLFTGPFTGILTGAAIGLLAIAAGRLLRSAAPQNP
jgi:hypothetical protein